MADNFWYLNEWPEHPVSHKYTHQNFNRNIEPTILPDEPRFATERIAEEEWLIEPRIILPEVSEENLKAWPFEEDPTNGLQEKLHRVDGQGKRWMVLYEFNNERQSYHDPNPGAHGARYEEFRFIYCVFVKKDAVDDFIGFLDAEQSLDVTRFQPHEYPDGPFILEAYWRDTWNATKFSEELAGAPENCEFSIPVAQYYWESHLDKTLPEGYRVHLPQNWFAQELGIAIAQDSVRSWADANGDVIVKSLRPAENKTAVVIDEKALSEYAKNQDITPVWILIAERNTWPNGHNDESCWRRSEGAWWREGTQWKHVSWNKDTVR